MEEKRKQLSKYESLEHFMKEELHVQLKQKREKSKIFSLKNTLNVCVISSAKQHLTFHEKNHSKHPQIIHQLTLNK
jgi:hypothetical protein